MNGATEDNSDPIQDKVIKADSACRTSPVIGWFRRMLRKHFEGETTVYERFPALFNSNGPVSLLKAQLHAFV